MIEFFKKLFGEKDGDIDKHPNLPIEKDLTNEELKEIRAIKDDYGRDALLMRSPDINDRIAIASGRDTHKEILYYMAKNDPDPEVRKAVVNNVSFPPHVSAEVAIDKDVDVRLALASRLVELLPNLTEDEHSKLYGFVVQAMATLALDQVVIVRRALSSSLKDCVLAPPEIYGKMARDLEREVSEPILKFCAALSDEDILDIISGHPDDWVVEAIAGREKISESVSSAVIDAEKEIAGKILLENENAGISEDLLKKIIRKSKEFSEWQKPVAVIKFLPLSLAKELAEFVNESVKDLLLRRGDYDSETIDEISEVFKRRVDFMEDKMANNEEPTSERVARMYKNKELDEDMVIDAIASRDLGFVFESLAILSDVEVGQVRQVIEMKAPKSITALVWKSGLSMRASLQIQKEIAHIRGQDLMYPRGGTDYPLTKEELNWQLDFLGLK